MARVLVGRVGQVAGLPAAVYRRGTGAGHQVAGLQRSQVASRAGAADGKELFWVESVAGTTRSKLMAAAIGQAPNPVGTPQDVVRVRNFSHRSAGNLFSYAPSADGQRFVVNVLSTAARPSLDVILNWGQTQSRR